MKLKSESWMGKTIMMLIPVTDEKGLSSPLECDTLALGDVVQLDFNLGQGQNVSGRTHAGKKLGNNSLGAVGSSHGGAWTR